MPTYNGTTGANVFVAPTTEDSVINGPGGSDTLIGNAGNTAQAGIAANATAEAQVADNARMILLPLLHDLIGRFANVCTAMACMVSKRANDR